MKLNSLGFRLFISSTILALTILSAAALLLISQYRSTIEINFDERLKANLSLLIERSFDENFEEPQKPGDLGGFAFTLLNSGWYWQIDKITGNSSKPLFLSKSIGATPLKSAKRQSVINEADGTVKFYINNYGERRLRAIERKLNLGNNESPKIYRYIVTGDSTEIDDEVIDFASMLTLIFFILGIGMIAATILQVRFGLKPLRVIQQGLTDIRAGKTKSLEGKYPAEIEPLQQEINSLIESNFNIIERARTHVGNLAHALKTPLSVIKNEVNSQSGSFAKKISEQTNIMQNQITHHLDRARMAARVGIVGGITEIHPIFLSIERALDRIYYEKEISFEFECPFEAKFAGEKQDFEEIVGNLLDNAFKWANSKVRCSVSTESHSLKPAVLSILIDDDGPGLTKAGRQDVMKRGKRLDETKPGSGLGLSIVADLIDLYNGTFELKETPTGGLSVFLQLPAVK